MKKITSLLAAGTAAIFCCSTASAQYSNAMLNATIIYSNAFTGGASVNITNSHPDFSSGLYGGSNGVNAAWMDLNGSAHTNYYYANGTLGSPQGGNVLLPFTPVTNHVYALYIKYTTSGSVGNWVAGGFGGYYQDGAPSSRSQFNSGGTAGYDWMLENYNSSAQFFLGPGGGGGSATGPYGAIAGTTHTMMVILDSTPNENSSNMWTGVAYNDGQLTGQITYTVNTGNTAPISIRGVGYGINGMTAPSELNVTWNSLILSANQELIIQQPVSATVNAGGAFTNSVLVGGTPPFAYQWYTNGVPLTNGGVISGATNSSLVISATSAAFTSTNYYCVVSNAPNGAITSSVASLTIYTNPVFLSLSPVAFTNPITLFGGGNVMGTNYFGSTPTFSVSAAGAQPITYQWQTNGVNVGYATGTSLTYTNCQLTGSPGSFACIASNSYGLTTNSWAASYVAAPTTPFPSLVLSYKPIGYWRLNEAEFDNAGDDGILALDYGSGNNGIYTNVYLGNNGYTTDNDPNNTDPTETAAQFGPGPDSDAYGIQGINFASPTNTTVNFSVGAWVNNGIGTEPSGAGIVAKGYGAGGEQFVLSVASGLYQFFVRDAGGVQHVATATVGPLNNNWQYVVGVCDETHGTVSIYVNGVSLGSGSVPTLGGLQNSTLPMSIGAKNSSASVSDNNIQYKGFINDVTAFNYALTAVQVQNLYQAAGYNLGFSVLQSPPPSFVYLTGGTMTISAVVNGQTPIGYYWTNLTTGGTIVSGTTNTQGANLIANLVISNTPASLNGDQIELVITNALYSTNWTVALSTPAPPISLGYTNAILYSNVFNGGMYSIAGQPLTAANLLYGGTNVTWTDALGTNDAGIQEANGTNNANSSGDCWLMPLKPQAGYVYTVTASVTMNANPGNWVAIGFANPVPTNATSGRFNDLGYNFVILNWGGNTEYFPGLGTSAATVTNATLASGFPGTHVMQVVLDTTGTQWVMYGFMDGTPMGTNTYASNPPISGVGIGQNAPITGANFVWNSFTVTQTSSGAPPYVLSAALPASVTLLANSPLTLPATSFSSFAPYGYYWGNTNTSAVLASGTTNNVAPLPVNLSVASVPSSWNGNTLALVLTNAYGTNISLVLLTVTNSAIIPTNQPWGTGFSIVGNNVVFNGTNGQSGGTYYLLGTTNLTTPVKQWLPVATNVILTNGPANAFTFTGTNVVHVTIPQQFYILSSTN